MRESNVTKVSPQLMPMIQFYYLTGFADRVKKDLIRIIKLTEKMRKKSISKVIPIDVLDGILQFSNTTQTKDFCTRLGITIVRKAGGHSVAFDELIEALENEVRKLTSINNKKQKKNDKAK